MITRLKHKSREMFDSLSVRNFRLYFIGQVVSQSGNWMQIVAIGWLVLEITGSGTALGLVTALQFLPVLLAGPWGGVLADRLDKRKILYVTQTISGVISLLLGFLVYFHAMEMWMLYVLALILGCIKVPDNPARQTFVMEMVGKDRLGNAVVLNSILMNTARIAGPMIGGIFIATVGLAFCFIINAVTYLATLSALYLMREEELERSPKPKGRGHLMEGFRYIRDTAMIRDILILMGLIGTFSIEFQVSLPLLAQGTFHGVAADYAALLSAMGAGSVLGGLYASSRKSVTAEGVTRSALLFGLSMGVTAIMPSLSLAIVAMIAVGFFAISLSSQANTLIQLESKPDMRGRVMSIWTMAIIGSTPIGGPVVGFIGEHAGPRFGLAIGSIAAIVGGIFAWLTLSDRRLFRRDAVSPEAEIAETAIESMKVR